MTKMSQLCTTCRCSFAAEEYLVDQTSNAWQWHNLDKALLISDFVQSAVVMQYKAGRRFVETTDTQLQLVDLEQVGSTVF